MKKVSYSQYTTWANCPWAWKLKYIDGHKIDDTSINTIFGTAMHEVIQSWLDTLYNKSETVAKTVYLHDDFKTRFLRLFKENVTEDASGNKTFLCDKQTLMEYYEQGCKILSYVQENYRKLFPTASTKLFAIEYELNMEVHPNVQYVGFIDIVTYNEATDKYVLYDLKTSRAGWDQATKSDPLKTSQLLLYKRFFAQQRMLDEDQISVEFVILKRIIFEDSPYPIPRVSKFEPSNKTPSLTKAWNNFEMFLATAFDDEGNYKSDQTPKPDKKSCRWCVFRDRKDLCAVGVK